MFSVVWIANFLSVCSDFDRFVCVDFGGNPPGDANYEEASLLTQGGFFRICCRISNRFGSGDTGGDKVWDWVIKYCAPELLYTGLGETQQERADEYEAFLDGTITEEEKQVLLGAVQRGQLTGGKFFVDEVEQKLARRIELRGQGRPRKVEK